MFFKSMSRRNAIRLLGMGLLGSHAYAQSARLSIGKTSAGTRVLATLNPPDSTWELLMSKDGGQTWSTVLVEPVLISTGKLRWDLPTENKVGMFRLRLATRAVIQLPGNIFFEVANGQTLFAAMEAAGINFEWKLQTLGRFVTHIGGVAGKWVFEVNGNMFLDAGSSGYILQKNDEIKWFRV